MTTEGLKSALGGSRARRGLVLLIGLLTIALVWHAWWSSSDHDEIVYLHSAWLVSEGLVPFRDFVEHHHPTLYYVLAPIVAAVSPDPALAVFGGRMVNLAFIVLTIGVTMRIARLTGRTPARATWALLILAGGFTFLRNMLEVRPDTAMVAFAYVGLERWLVFVKRRSNAAAIVAGLAFGIAVVFLQKVVLTFALVVLGTAAWVWIERPAGGFRELARGTLLATIAMAVPVALFALAIARAGYFDDFYFWNYDFNHFYYLRSKAADSPWPALGFSFGVDPVMWGLGLWGAFVLARRALRDRERPPLELVIATFVLAGVLGFLLRNQFPYQHNLVPAMPAAALLGAAALERVEGARAKTVWAVVLALMVVKVVIITGFYDENSEDRRIQRWVLAHSAPGDALHIPAPYHPIYRRDAWFFWYDGARKAEPYASYCKERGCARDRLAEDDARPLPRLVYLAPDFKISWPVAWERIRDRYAPTDLPDMYRLRE